MEDISKFFDLLDKSDIILLGYTCKYERIKDKILSKINPIHIDISKDLPVKSFIRDKKIDSVLCDSEFKSSRFFTIDTSEILPSSVSESRHQLIRRTLENARSEFINTNYKLIILSQMNNSIVNISSFSGCSGVMFSCDVVFVLNEKTLSVIKNRHSENFNISLENLNKFDYICNYENNK